MIIIIIIIIIVYTQSFNFTTFCKVEMQWRDQIYEYIDILPKIFFLIIIILVKTMFFLCLLIILIPWQKLHNLKSREHERKSMCSNVWLAVYSLSVEAMAGLSFLPE